MNKRYALKVIFRKERDMIFFSQLDIFRLFIRALRRANLPIVYTCGFNPHPKISFKKALKLGQAGELETIFYFEREITPLEFKERFSPQIPQDLILLGIEPISK